MLREPCFSHKVLRAGTSRFRQVRARVTTLPRLIARRWAAIRVANSSSSKTRAAAVVAMTTCPSPPAGVAVGFFLGAVGFFFLFLGAVDRASSSLFPTSSMDWACRGLYSKLELRRPGSLTVNKLSHQQFSSSTLFCPRFSGLRLRRTSKGLKNRI